MKKQLLAILPSLSNFLARKALKAPHHTDLRDIGQITLLPLDTVRAQQAVVRTTE